MTMEEKVFVILIPLLSTFFASDSEADQSHSGI